MTPTHEDFVSNIVTTYRTATSAQITAGMGWYPTARNLACEISPDNVLLGAGMIAVHSIQTSWILNERYARQAMETRVSPHGLGMVRGKAAAMFAGGDILALLGQKTTSFAQNIAYPVSDIVTIDRHARDIAFGAPVPKNPSISKGLYNRLSDAYRVSAGIENILPSEMQAVTWVVWRDRKNLSWAG